MSDLHAFRTTIAGLTREYLDRHAHPLVLVPTTGAAQQLRGALPDAPDHAVLTRDGLYAQLHARLHPQPRRLTPYERDVIAQASVRAAGRESARGGFVAEVLRFYDQLRRQNGSVGRFEELIQETLSRDAEFDRGAARMLAETRMLAAAFREYERRVEASGACDEHGLRHHVIQQTAASPSHSIVVTVGDWIADAHGLYVADFDLLTRAPGVAAIDVVATEGLLGSGFHQRIHDWLPGIEEVEASALGLVEASTVMRPVLEVPDIESGNFVFVRRDREEELIAEARQLKGCDQPGRAAVVFMRPLPYLYLASEVFRNAGIPFRAADTLPLAAESPAAALDLVLDAVESGFTRASLAALLRSPHFLFTDEDLQTRRDTTSAFDRKLSDERYLGGLEALRSLELRWKGSLAQVPLRAAIAIAERLDPLLEEAPAADQLMRVIAFLDDYQAPLNPDDRLTSRLARGRTAVREALIALATAHADHDDRPMSAAEVASTIRRWIEEQTFIPESQDEGIALVDEQTARYGEFDRIALVGLIEGEWPERPKRNIFYPPSLLASLGWPTEKDRRSATEARFVELLSSARRHVTVSTVMLDDEALVEPSSLLDAIPRARLQMVEPSAEASLPATVFRDEVLMSPSAEADLSHVLPDDGREWLAMRFARSPHAADQFHGRSGILPERMWSVSSLETYIGCPFRFFAQYVLKLQEEPEDEEVMDPRSQGEFVHGVFQEFFERWQREGHQAVTRENLETARTLFGEVVETRLADLSPNEAGLERTRLLGSPAAAGLGEAVFRMEVERTVPVVERLLEHPLKGSFVFRTRDGSRTIALSGKADRLDLLADGTFRLIDYKLGWPPNKARALQLPIYSLCAEQVLNGRGGQTWTVGEAAYVAFKGPRRVVPVISPTSSPEERARTLAEAQERLVSTIDAIAAGNFPPTPDDVFRCETCAYSAVCRLDYVGDA